MKKVIISVSNKDGLIPFAKELINLKFDIYSTGGTYKTLKKHKVNATEISKYTEFPELLDGRLKTLHPKIHGGILADLSKKKHLNDLKSNGIEIFSLVVVNLYPFIETIKNNSFIDKAIENIDIGGPTMIRAAAKNWNHTTVVIDPDDYSDVLSKLRSNNDKDLSFRFKLACKAFNYSAIYDGAISNYLSSIDHKGNFLNENKLPNQLNLSFTKKSNLRYGENPHQKAAFYIDSFTKSDVFTNFKQIHGRELSFNNLADSNAAIECVKSLKKTSCVIVKHANPCGVGSSTNSTDAYKKALSSDPSSAFGGIIALNSEIDENLAKEITKQFVEVIICQGFSNSAYKILSKKKNLRLLQLNSSFKLRSTGYDLKKIDGGILYQSVDTISIDQNSLKFVTKIKPNSDEIKDLLFAWNVVRHVKSNAIVFCRNESTLGIGAGQMSRIDSVNFAIQKSKNNNHNLKLSVVASDAFFPFKDSLESIASTGARCIIQPGGSIRDKEVINVANELGLSMVFTSQRHFKH